MDNFTQNITNIPAAVCFFFNQTTKTHCKNIYFQCSWQNNFCKFIKY